MRNETLTPLLVVGNSVGSIVGVGTGSVVGDADIVGMSPSSALIDEGADG